MFKIQTTYPVLLFDDWYPVDEPAPYTETVRAEVEQVCEDLVQGVVNLLRVVVVQVLLRDRGGRVVLLSPNPRHLLSTQEQV